jgi:hypothetical protein
MKARRLEVTWYDAASLTSAWDDLDAVLSKEGRSLVRIRSVGYVLADDKRVLILAGSVHGKRVGSVTIIPRKSVLKRKRLR